MPTLTEIINSYNPDANPDMPYVQGGDTGGWLDGVGETLGPGSSITKAQAQNYYNDALKQFSKGDVDDFLARNKNDYNRIVEALKSEWGGAGAGLSREQSGQMQSQGYSFTDSPGMTWTSPTGKVGTSYNTSESGVPFRAGAGANIPQGWWNEGGSGSGGGGGGGSDVARMYGSSGAYSSVPGSSSGYESGVAAQNALLGDFGNTPDWMRPFTEQFEAPTEEEARLDPGWEFRLAEGEKARQRAAAAKGTLLTGGTAKALERYAQDYSSEEYDKVYGRDLDEYMKRYGIFRTNEADRFNSQSQNRAANLGIYNSQWDQGRTERMDDYGMWHDQQTMTLQEAQLQQNMERMRLEIAARLGSAATASNISNIMREIGQIKAAGGVVSADIWSRLVGSYGLDIATIIRDYAGSGGSGDDGDVT
jgi:hypothetical protein